MINKKGEQELIEQQKEHFNSIADVYLKARSNNNHKLIKRLMWKQCLNGISLDKNKKYRVLEAMCGYAEGEYIVQEYLGVEVDYQGFDYSDVVIENLIAAKPGIDVRKEDVTSFKPDEGVYDIVILIGGLHHVPSHAGEVVKNLTLGLKEGGLFISFEPTYSNQINHWVRKKIYKSNDLFDEETERDFSVIELKGIFEAASMSPLCVNYPGLVSYVLFYNPDAFPFLNVGGEWLVKATFFIDRFLYRSRLGGWLSFATLSVWVKDA